MASPPPLLFKRAAARHLAARLAPLCQLRSGLTVAEVGGGDGTLALALLKHVQPTGRLFVTEMPGRKFARMAQRLARRAPEIAPVESSATDCGLPPGESDAIVMRDVYHHFSQPVEFAASLAAALAPGGRLAAVDFPPRRLLSLFGRPDGVPANRGGHGIAADLLVAELTAAGLRHHQTIARWRGDRYLALFGKP